MGIIWDWAFGNETTGTLATEAGFAFGGAGLATSSDVYTYTGSPTRYSMGLSTNSSTYNVQTAMTLPVGAGLTQGIVSFPFRMAWSSVWNRTGYRLAQIDTVSTSFNRYIEIQTAASGAVSLYIDNSWKGTSRSLNLRDWHYFALVFNTGASTWTGSMYIDGALEASGSDAAVYDQVISITLWAAQYGLATYGYPNVYGQVILYGDTVADLAAAIDPNTFVTRVAPNADGTNVGTWTPSAGVDDYAVVDPPIDATTYTEIAAPAPNDRVEVLTNAGGADLATALGLTPNTIYGASIHAFSTGQAITSEVGIGDGATEDLSTASAVSPTTTTYQYYHVGGKPSGGSWAGTDQPTFVYEIDTV